MKVLSTVILKMNAKLRTFVGSNITIPKIFARFLTNSETGATTFLTTSPKELLKDAS